MQLSGTALPVVLPTKAMVTTPLPQWHWPFSISSSWSGYFMSLREAVRSGVELQGSELLRYSRCFRSALHECVLALREEERRTLSGKTCGRKSMDKWSVLSVCSCL